MADRGSEFWFLGDKHVRIDIRTGIFISLRPMFTKFEKQIGLEELPQVKLLK